MAVWDFEGTVGDMFPAAWSAANAALSSHGMFARPDEDVLRQSIGLSPYRILSRLVDDASLLPEGLVEAFVRTYRRQLDTAIPTRATAIPRVTHVLDELDDHGVVSVLMATNARRVVMPALHQLDIADYFAGVITDDALACHQRRPHPETVLRACRDHSIDPADTIVIGDTTLDVQMGHAAGAATIAVTWGHHRRGELADARPTELVDDPAELGAVLRARLGEQVGERAG